MAGSTVRFAVTDADTALAVGSGSLPVLGTPRLLAWCEAATCAAVEAELAAGETSVGTRVDLEHLAATAVGGTVEVTARQVYADGRLRRFAVSAREVGPDGTAGKLVGSGEVTRVVVDADRFMAKVSRQSG
ncbi:MULTISPECIES: thioesterase family protein [unclassified Nocardioides]|uniref:thioesterase family protein n=1 Tax=unclassified Nocardioides TaxID=2615069 RepID=UPI001173C3A7|nr:MULTISPECIES: thioesterase [unclassified Nocardioides]TQK70454.1 putative thioesterase [Nocardioides sp. SLBN-35]WGY00154.1 thioesterase [Nocardioides sp. QY071]